jgi:hypothetical protein
MVINDQNTHWHWSRTPASLPLLHRIRRKHRRSLRGDTCRR